MTRARRGRAVAPTSLRTRLVALLLLLLAVAGALIGLVTALALRTFGGGPGGGFGGGVGPASTDVELVALLQAAGTTWSAATSSTAASAQLALDSGTDVIGIGGFSGSDPAPTLEQFQALVAAGQVRYYVVGGGPGGPGAVDPRQLLEQLPPALREDPQLVEQLESGGFPGGGGRDPAIATWVEENFPAVQVGGTAVHDLAAPAG